MCRAVALALLAAGSSGAVEVRLLDHWSGTFPATTSVWRVQVEPAAAEITWELRLGNAAVDRGHRVLNSAAAGQAVPLPLRIPPLRDGLAGEATLLVRVASGGATAQVAHPVWILPRDPWVGMRDTLAQGPLRVFDPEGTLTDRLGAAGLGSAALRNPAAIAALTNGLLIVGEGVSLRAQRGLADALVRAAAGGTRVLLLAPADGALPLPGHEALAALPLPATRLESSAALTRLDKRLDAAAWPDRPGAVASSAVFSADRRQPEATWSPGPAGWAWLDLDFRAAGGGRLLAVGWAPVAAWDSGPAPRHILAALLRHLLE